MANDNDCHELCRLAWRLTRRHGWSGPIPEQDLLNALDSHAQGRGKRELLDDLCDLDFVDRRGGGYIIVPNTWEDLAYFLRDNCGYTEIQIEATLSSHFDGFDN